MNSLFGILTNPLASTFGAAAGSAVNSAATSFESLLSAAHANGSTSDSGSDGDSSPDLQDRVAAELRKLLGSFGVGGDDRVTLHIDKKSGEIKLDRDQPRAAEIEAALNGNKSLTDGIRQLAKANDLFHDSPFIAETELEVDMSADQPADMLRWL